MSPDSVRTVWSFLDYELPLWAVSLLIPVLYGSVAALWWWAWSPIRRRRRPDEGNGRRDLWL